MADLTAGLRRDSQAASSYSWIIADALQLIPGNFAGLRGPQHATSQGHLDHYDNEKGMFALGNVVMPETQARLLGDTDGTDYGGPPKGAVHLGPVIYSGLTVTGVSSLADVLKPVYMTDGNTFTLTRAANCQPVGVVWDYEASQTKVLFWGAIHQLILDMSGPYEIINLGEIDFATSADGNLRTGWVAPYHGRILEVFGMTSTTLVGSGGTILVNLEIGGTDVTGGVVTMATATQGTLGTKSAGTAVTAENEFHEADAIDVEGASAAGTRTSGAMTLFMKVERLPGV